MSKPDIQAVLFDIGNVLLTWQPERHYDAWIGAQRRRELFASSGLLDVNEALDRGGDFRATIYDLAERVPEFRTEIRWWFDRWHDLITPPISHSVRLLRALRGRGVPVFALSNFGSDSFAISEARHDFLAEFDRRYISGQMGVVKPEARIYEMVEQDCALPPEALFFTDDRAENTEAAAGRGWQTHLFTGSEGLAARLVALGLLREEDAG